MRRRKSSCRKTVAKENDYGLTNGLAAGKMRQRSGGKGLKMSAIFFNVKNGIPHMRIR
jgi:hypothetical protein